jgi:hypothetical protein
MLDVSFDLRGIEMTEHRLAKAFAYKQLGTGDVIRGRCRVGDGFRDTYLVARQIGDMLPVAISATDATDIGLCHGIAVLR